MTRIPGAIWRPGPVGKKYWHQWMVNPVIQANEGATIHSMDGPYSAALTVLDDESVTPQNSYRAASWLASILMDGTKIQHYEIEDCPFHAGGPLQGTRLAGIELEGKHWQSVPDVQAQATKEVIDFLAEQGGWVPSRGEAYKPKTLWEHREIYNTACPAGRFDSYWGRWVVNGLPEPSLTTWNDGFHPELGLKGQYRTFVDVAVPDMKGDPPHLALGAPHLEWSGTVNGYVWRYDVDVDTSHLV